MSTEDREESRPRKIIPSIGRRENTDQEGERRPYNQNFNRAEGGNYERRSYNRPDWEDRGGNRPYGNRPSYGDNRNAYGDNRNSYGDNRNTYGDNNRNSYQDRQPYGENRPFNRPQKRTYDNNAGYDRPYNRDNRNYGNNDRGYGNREGGYNNRPSYGNREGGYNRPSYGNPYERRDNNFNRPVRSYPPAQEGPEETAADGSIKKRRPRVGETRVNAFDNNRGGRMPYDNNRQPYGGGRPQNNQRFRKPMQRSADYNSNAKYSFQKQLKYKEVLADPNEPIRLNKFLANAGVCSRREADELIQAGEIKVNDVVVTELGTKITRSDNVVYKDKQVQIEGKIYVLLNKPKNCVTTSDDPQERLTVMDLVRNACQERIYPVGRLDRNTTGVLLLTNDGDLASKLTHPSFKKKKIYHVWLDKPVSIEDMEKIANGLELEDGEIHADAISYASEDDKKQIGIEIHSGRNRIVRRIFESLGYHVMKLDRVYFAGLTKKNLPKGKWRYLNEREVNALRMGAFE